MDLKEKEPYVAEKDIRPSADPSLITDRGKDRMGRETVDVVGRLAPATPLRTLQEVLQSFGRSDADNRDKKTLGPEHPLMVKYQKDLKEHFLKLHEETDAQLAYMKGEVNGQVKGNDEIGKNMCSLQKDFVQLEKNVSQYHSRHMKAMDKKMKSLKKQNTVKETHMTHRSIVQQEQDTDLKIQKQLEDLSLQVVQLRELQLESYSDSSTMKRALEKTTKQREDLEIEKLRQDMLIARLEMDKHVFEDKISLHKSQCAIKKEQLADLRKVLHAASIDLEAIHFEKLLLIQQWNYSISSLAKGDETGAVMRESVRNFEDHMKTLNMDIVNHKKLIRRELEENENITLHLLQREADAAHLEMRLSTCKEQESQLEEQYSFFSQVIQHTEDDLAVLKNEMLRKEKEMEDHLKQLERIMLLKREMEETHIKTLHEKMTATKATRFNEKLIKECRQKIENLEDSFTLKEGEEGKIRLKLGKAVNNLRVLGENLASAVKSFEEKEKDIEKCEAELIKNNKLLEKKQTHILELNKTLTNLISEAGGQELGPMEREIAHIKQEFAASEELRKVKEQEWLQYQWKLVSLTNESAAHFKDMDMMRKKEAVLEEQKIRNEVDLSREEKEIKELNQSIEHVQKDMARLMVVLHREKISDERLQQETELLQGDFLSIIKKAELDFIKDENEVEYLKKICQRLSHKLIQLQHEEVMWEEKIKLAEETEAILNSKGHAEAIANYKSEITRLQLLLDQIKNEEATLMTLMEKAVEHYANLYRKADYQLFRGVKKKSKEYLASKRERLKSQVEEEKKKLKVIMEEISSENKKLYELKLLEKKNSEKLADLGKEIKSLEYNMDNKEQEENQHIIAMTYKLKRTKLLQQLKNQSYVWAKRNPEHHHQEIKQLKDTISLLQDFAEETASVHPQELMDTLPNIQDYISVALTL